MIHVYICTCYLSWNVNNTLMVLTVGTIYILNYSVFVFHVAFLKLIAWYTLIMTKDYILFCMCSCSLVLLPVSVLQFMANVGMHIVLLNHAPVLQVFTEYLAFKVAAAVQLLVDLKKVLVLVLVLSRKGHTVYLNILCLSPVNTVLSSLILWWHVWLWQLLSITYQIVMNAVNGNCGQNHS